jgi:glutathione S-transferase
LISKNSRDSEFVLYGVAESGNCYKVALMLDLCKLAWQPQEVKFFDNQERSEFTARLNALSEMPVLHHNGESLSQTGVILTYLSEITGKFCGRNDREKRDVLRWLLFDNHKFTSFYQLTRQEHGLKRNNNTAVIDFIRARAESALAIVNTHLASNSYVATDRPTIADISMVGFLYYDEETGIDMTKYPNIARWKSSIAELPGWRHPYRNELARGLDWSNGEHPVWPAH